MDVNYARKNVIKNLFWRFAERCGAQGVSFVVSIILARILMPEMYGTVALVTVFITIFQVFVDSGLGKALIQKKNADDLDFSTMFYFNIVVCILLYFIIFLTAPVIATFYRDDSLIPIVRALSVTIVISGVKNVQQAYISRMMQFEKFFFSTLGGTIGAAVVGIVLAYMGAGVWALVVQQLFNSAVDTMILWLMVPWRPKRMFSVSRLKSLFSYGWKLLVSSLIYTSYSTIQQLVIGKMYSPADLAYYNKGEQLPNLIVINVDASIDSVLLPVLSRAQNDSMRMKQMTRRAIVISTYIMAPLMMGLAFIAPTVIELLLTSKWLSCVPYLRIFCITFMFYPIHTANLNAINALGRSDLFLKLEIIKVIIGIAILFSVMKFGVLAIAYSALLDSLLSQIINAWPNRKLLSYTYLEQIKDILPSILLAVLMGILTSFIAYLPITGVGCLILQIFTGLIIYIAGSVLFKLEAFQYLYEITGQLTGKRYKKN